MIKDKKLLREFEKEQIIKERFSYLEALKIFEGMWQQGVTLGVLPPKDALEGIETDIKIARILNQCSKK